MTGEKNGFFFGRLAVLTFAEIDFDRFKGSLEDEERSRSPRRE